MIDITPYQQKLTWLQEWIELRIEKRILFVLVEHFKQKGSRLGIHHSEPTGWEFEVFCAYKQQQEANIKYVTN